MRCRAGEGRTDIVILDRFRLDDRVAVVTGGNHGLGLGIAAALAGAGADIVSIQRTDAVPALQETVARVGRRTLSLTRDLTTDGVAAEALAATLRHYSHVDILVNNAGVQHRASAADIPIANWDAVVAVDLRAVVAVNQTVGREMLRQGSGKIINATSLLAFQGGSLSPLMQRASMLCNEQAWGGGPDPGAVQRVSLPQYQRER